MEQIIKDMRAIIRHLDKAAELAKKDPYTAIQERMEEA